MDISLIISRGGEPIEVQLALAEAADAHGLYGTWYGQHLRYDSATLATMAGHRTEHLVIGSGVIPAYPRHPLTTATQALTIDIATDHRYRIGIGPSHRSTIEGIYGLEYRSPARYLEEYLTVLRQLIHDRETEFEGEYFRVHAKLDQPEAGSDIPIFTGSLGPLALEVSGRLADGNLTYLAGPRTITEHVIPRLSDGANAAGRELPRVAAAVPVMVTDDLERARIALDGYMDFHTAIDVYRAIIEREGVEHPSELAIVGDADRVREGIERFRAAGVVEFTAAVFGTTEDKLRTIELLGAID